ncbi:MAG: TetR/AcrR family transcriptional regulator [Campylobacterota bacterium]
MPKIVDKEQKRKEIATLSKKLLLAKGIAHLTVAEVAKNAGIGKGTIYQYFKNKDDIVFAIIDAFVQQELDALDADLGQLEKFEDKLFRYFDFLLSSKQPYRQKQLKNYLEYLSISIVSSDASMQAFNLDCRDKFKKRLHKIVDEAIEKKEIKPQAKDLVLGLYSVEKGFVLLSGLESDGAVDVEMRQFLNALLVLMKEQK